MDPVVDAESGLIYLRARYYDPATGQFLSRDPLVALTGEAYGYAGNNPLNGTDPLGLYDYSLQWNIGPGSQSDAAQMMAEIQQNPNDFFPFHVAGGPIALGAKLHLESRNSRIGDVTVSGCDANWFSFNTEPGHIEGYPATVMFTLDSSGGEIHFRVDAHGPDGRFQWGPIGWVTNQVRTFEARDLWSGFALNIREHFGYVPAPGG